LKRLTPIAASRAPALIMAAGARRVTQLAAIDSVHVAAFIEQARRARSAPTAKSRSA
jgi:hypothetical protein